MRGVILFKQVMISHERCHIFIDHGTQDFHEQQGALHPRSSMIIYGPRGWAAREIQWHDESTVSHMWHWPKMAAV